MQQLINCVFKLFYTVLIGALKLGNFGLRSRDDSRVSEHHNSFQSEHSHKVLSFNCKSKCNFKPNQLTVMCTTRGERRLISI